MPSTGKRAGARESRPGPGATAHVRVSGIQRQRLLAAAMADVTAERGAVNVTVAHVVARSGVSRRTFYNAVERRTRIIKTLVQAIDEGRNESRPGKEPPALAAEGVVGAVNAVIHSRLLEASSMPLASLTGLLMSIIVLPIPRPRRGATGARQASPAAPRKARQTRRDPLEGLDRAAALGEIGV